MSLTSSIHKWWFWPHSYTLEYNSNRKIQQLAQWFWRRFFKVLSIFEHGSHLGHVTWTIYINFCSPLPKEAPHKIWLWLAKRFQRRRCLNIVDDDGLMPEQGYTISSPCEPDSSGELKNPLKIVILTSVKIAIYGHCVIQVVVAAQADFLVLPGWKSWRQVFSWTDSLNSDKHFTCYQKNLSSLWA